MLTHELQHAIHWLRGPHRGYLAQRGVVGVGRDRGRVRAGQHSLLPASGTNASLVNWPKDLDGDIGLNYGAAALFAHYLQGAVCARGWVA